jgi:hypothetical protein
MYLNFPYIGTFWGGVFTSLQQKTCSPKTAVQVVRWDAHIREGVTFTWDVPPLHAGGVGKSLYRENQAVVG